MIVGVLACYALIHSVYDLKSAQINMRHNLICRLILYESKLGHNTIKTTKNICCLKGEGTVDHRAVTRWFKKLCSRCNNINNARQDNSKGLNYKSIS